MKCPDIEIFDDYLLGLLSPESSNELEAHLAVCPKCRAIMERERLVDEWLRRQKQIPAPPEFFRQVMNAIARKTVRRTLPDWIWAAGIGLFAAYVGIFVGKFGGNFTPLLMGKLRSFIAGIGSQITLDWVAYDDLVLRFASGNNLLIVNFAVAGIILCWGLWQVVKALRR